MHADHRGIQSIDHHTLGSLSIPDYAASALATGNSGKQEAFGLLGYFASEQAACQFAVEYAKAHIDGRRYPEQPLSLP